VGRGGARPLSANLLLAALSLAVSLLVAEGIVRVFGLGPPRGAAPAQEPAQGDERRNSLGFRGPEWTPEPAAGTARVLFIGDSFTYGRGVGEENLFTSVAARELSTSSRPVESVNVSKPGWDTHDEVAALEKWGLGYHPGLVVIVFFLNDATHLDSNPAIAWRMNRELNQRDGWLNRASRLYDTADYAIRKWSVTRQTVADYRDSYLGSPEHSALWERCRLALARGRDLCRERSVPMCVVIFPMLVRLDRNHPFRDVHEAVAGACREIGVPVLDLLGAFEGRDGHSLWLAPNNAHPNIEGHEIAGKAIAAFIRERGLLDGPGAHPAGS